MHWFWRGTIAVVAASVYGGLSARLLQERYAFIVDSISFYIIDLDLLMIGSEAIVKTVFWFTPVAALAVGVYGVLTRFLGKRGKGMIPKTAIGASSLLAAATLLLGVCSFVMVPYPGLRGSRVIDGSRQGCDIIAVKGRLSVMIWSKYPPMREWPRTRLDWIFRFSNGGMGGFNSGLQMRTFVLRLWVPLFLFAFYPTIAFIRFIRGPVRRRRRRRKGQCIPCGYDLTGNVSGVCPECGSKT